MKVLQVVGTPQTISIQPRKDATEIATVDVFIRLDGEGTSETINAVSITNNGNFVDLTFSCSILKEGETYTMELTNSGELIYRDKIYATDKTDFTIKHKQAQDNYTEYDSVDDNTYII